MRSPTVRATAAFGILPLLLSVVIVALQGTTPAQAQAAPPTPTVELVQITNSGDQVTRRWVRYDLSVPYDATIEVTANWDGSAGDVNTFLYDDSRSLVAFANSPDLTPETFTHRAAAGEYSLAVLVKSGSADYTVDVTATPPPPLEIIENTGDQSEGRWQTFPFTLTTAAPITILADWDGDGDVNMFLRDTDRRMLSFANGTASRPERLTYDAAAGDYEVAVLVKSGAASYLVEIYDSEHAPSVLAGEPAPLEEDFEPAYPGQPAPGMVKWGAAVGGNEDPVVRHEDATGVPLAVRRTFYQWPQRTGYMISMAQGDLAAGRLPWVSVKTPPWAEMGAGDHDGAIDEMLRALDELNGPVWLTIHHEPEGGGGVNRPDDPAGPAGHLAMNRRVRERMTALGTDNVALASVMMSYTWESSSGRDPDEWWAPGIYDFLGVDHYVYREATLVNNNWREIRAWAAARGVDIAVGEWGVRGTDFAAGARVREWYDSAAGSHADGAGARVVGLAAFDSGLHSPSGSWELRGEQLRAFHELMSDPRSAYITVD